VTVAERLSDVDPLSLPDGVWVGVRESEAVPDPVEVSELVGVDVRVIVVELVPVSEPVFDELAPTVTEAVGVRDTDRERLVVELGVIDDVPVPDSVEVTELVGVDDRVIVVEPVPESEPVLDELAPAVTEAVGEEDADRERLAVELGVIDDVAVFELVGVLVGVPLPEALDETLELSEILEVILALAPNVTEGVAEFDNDALRVDVDDGVSDEVPVPEVVPDPVLVCEGVGEGVMVGDCDDESGRFVGELAEVSLSIGGGDKVGEPLTEPSSECVSVGVAACDALEVAIIWATGVTEVIGESVAGQAGTDDTEAEGKLLGVALAMPVGLELELGSDDTDAEAVTVARALVDDGCVGRGLNVPLVEEGSSETQLILRMLLFRPSDTNTVWPVASTARPLGPRKSASKPGPSTLPWARGRPASVKTAPVPAIIFRIIALPVSAT
jgi:hypothetical protein